MNEGLLRRLIRRKLNRAQTTPRAVRQPNESVDLSSAAVEAQEDDGAPDEYEPEYTWGPVANAPDEHGSAGYRARSTVERQPPREKREHP
jgi:hypothetical protein